MRLRTPIVPLLVASRAPACALQTHIPDGTVATARTRWRPQPRLTHCDVPR